MARAMAGYAAGPGTTADAVAYPLVSGMNATAGRTRIETRPGADAVPTRRSTLPHNAWSEERRCILSLRTRSALSAMRGHSACDVEDARDE